MREARLGEVCELHYGKSLGDYHSSSFDEFSIRVFGTNGPIGWCKTPLFDQPTIVVGRKGAYRGVRLSHSPSWTIDTAYYTTISDPNVDLTWLYYRLLVVDINRMDSGSAIPSTKREDFYSVRIRIPALRCQQRAAATLAAYDDLIENNRRRIQLLEQSVRLLYKEWFVHLRFPGHEHVKLTADVPKGWRKTSIGEACMPGDGIQTGPFGSQLHASDYTDEGVPVIMPKDIAGNRISTDSIARIPEALADSLGRHRMAAGDVIYGRRGDIGRRAFITKRSDGWFCGTGCLRLRPDPAVVIPRYFFDALGSPETAGTIVARAKGATMPNLNTSLIASAPLLVPPPLLQREYVDQVQAAFDLVEILDAQNAKLTAARDLLLPRLMSGELVA